MNDYVTAVLDAATNPRLAGSEAERLPEAWTRPLWPTRRTAKASPARGGRRRPQARGAGTALSQLVSEDRRVRSPTHRRW